MAYLVVLLRRISADIFIILAMLVAITVILRLLKFPVTFGSFMLSFALSLLLRWIMIKIQRGVQSKRARKSGALGIEGGSPEGDASRGAQNRFQ